MWITIIADASFCPETNMGGYGFWIASKRGKLGGDGVLKGRVENNIAAEIMALLNALHASVAKGLVCKGDNVLLQTDCQPAIDALKNRRQNLSKQEEELIKHYQNFLSVYKIQTRFKHVKGHTTNEEARYVVNNICDRNARRNMRQARDEYRDQQIRKYLYETDFSM